MRSRTELVTTTFVDSEDDQSDDTDDSEEDWRPNADKTGRNGKRKMQKAGRKRRGPKPGMKRKRAKDEDDDDSDDGAAAYEKYYRPVTHSEKPATTTLAAAPATAIDLKASPKKLPPEKNLADRSGTFKLYLYKRDLDKDYKNNTHLCLWRRDGSSLLQKYIRVKSNGEEFIFTSSSVYSSWDEKRRKEFAVLSVKCLEENNRRVTITDLEDFHNLAEEMISRKEMIEKGEIDEKTEEDCSDGEHPESQEEEDDFEDSESEVEGVEANSEEDESDNEEPEECGDEDVVATGDSLGIAD